MQFLFDILNVPLSWIMRGIMWLCGGNFAGALFIFTLLLNLAMTPLNIKSQKSMVQQIRLKPKLDEIKRKYGDDRMRMNQETQKLYTDEGVSMAGGCLPMLIRLPIFMSFYWLVRSPLTYLANLPKSVIQSVWDQITAAGLNNGKTVLDELQIINLVHAGKISSPEVQQGMASLDFNFFGLNLTQQPHFSLNIFRDAEWIWLIPLLSFVTALLSAVISMKLQKRINPDAPSMGGMLLFMPVFSLIIAFTVPAGVGFYWACSNLISGLLQTGLQIWYSPQHMLAKERVKECYRRYEDEQKKIATRSARGAQDASAEE